MGTFNALGFLAKIVFLLVFFLATIVPSQTKRLDSLKLELKNAKHDTTRCIILNSIIGAEGDLALRSDYNNQLKTIAEKNMFRKFLAVALNNEALLYETEGDMSKSLECYSKSLKIFQEIGDKKEQAVSLDNLGTLYKSQGDLDKALDYFLKGLKIQEEIGDKKGIAGSLNSIGNLYNYRGEIPKALEYFTKSLKIQEEIGDKYGIAYSLNSIGFIYRSQGEIPKALEYYVKSLKIQEEIGDKKGIATALNNIGFVYKTQRDIPKAMEYFEKSLRIEEEIGDKKGIALSLNNIGGVSYARGDISKALECFQKSLKIQEEIGDKKGIALSLNNITAIYWKQKNYVKGLEFGLRSMRISKEIGYPESIENAADKLTRLYRATGNHKLALENYELYITMRDSLNNIETQKATIKQQTKYEYDKQKAVEDEKHAAEIKQQEEKALADKKRQNIIIGSVSLVLLLVAIFSVILFNRFKVTQKQKAIIEVKEKETQLQKHLIEEKHKEITDSINYAERIQKSFLATKKHLDENLSEYFILFRPKDVVSGDFYWSATLNNGNFVLATADSTGHGVPGAIMSLLNITSLEKAIETETSPDKILNATRKIIIDRLKKDGSPDGGKDGMDCSLCVFDFKHNKLIVANANNPVWIVRPSLRVTEGNEAIQQEQIASATPRNDVIEVKGDKMPVGKHDKQDTPFTVKEYDLQKGDIIYTLTDGFPDQFGGENGKKFMSKKLRELLTANAHLPMQQQKSLLEKTFDNWVGSLEQVDDVTVIGIRI